MENSRFVRDQLGNRIHLASPPQRIVSLVPSQTELLFDLGLGERVVGVTKFCTHPLEAREKKTIVGGTKQFDFETIDRLKPDLIIGNKEENYQEGIELLAKRYPVFMSDIFSMKDALEMIKLVGQLCDREEAANMLADKIEGEFAGLKKRPPLHVLYFIWRKPWMVAGTNTFIHSMIDTIGWRNAIQAERYPELTSHQISSSQAEIVLLSSEPYPFKEKHIVELQSLLPSAKIRLVDGEMFSWYGSRLLKAPGYLNSLEVG